MYVDDILLLASNADLLHEFVSFLRSHFKLKLLGVPTDVGLSRMQAPTQLLGLQLTWREGFRSVHISAEKLVRKVVRDLPNDVGYTLTDCHSECRYGSSTSLVLAQY